MKNEFFKKFASILTKNFFLKIEAKIVENTFFTQKCIQIAISVPDLHFVCFQLSFDVHIVHVGHK